MNENLHWQVEDQFAVTLQRKVIFIKLIYRVTSISISYRHEFDVEVSKNIRKKM